MFSVENLKALKRRIKSIDRKINILAFSGGDMIETTDKMFDLIDKKKDLLKELRRMKTIYHKLSKKYKILFYLEYKGLTKTQIARKLNINVSSVCKKFRKLERKGEIKNETTREQLTK